MRIRIRSSFFVYLACIAFLSSISACISALIALTIHEISHYAAAKLTGEQIAQLELTPFGGVMRYKPGTTSSKGLKGVLIHAAGPLANYVFLVFTTIPLVQQSLTPAFLRSLILSNAAMFILNLLPVLPLDGGHIVFCVGYYFFPIEKLVRLLSAMGVASGILGVLFTVYGCICRQMINCSLLIISLYLIVVAGQSRWSLLAENVYTVVQEQLLEPKDVKRITYYQAAPDTAMLDLLPYLKQGISVRVIISDGSTEHEMTERMLCQALMATPYATIAEGYHNFSQYQEK